jgi:23S rRNA G2445 N2-methylase RlmL
MPAKTAKKNEKEGATPPNARTPDALSIIVLSDSGCEEACCIEIRRWLPRSSPKRARPTMVELEGSVADAALLGYHLQTARRVLIRCAPTVKGMEELERIAIDPALKEKLFASGTTFKADGEVIAHNDENYDDKKDSKKDNDKKDIITQDLMESVGGWAYGQLGLQVDLKRPQTVIYAIASNNAIDIGVDVVGATLSKREYRIMLSSRSIKASVAAATILYSGAKDGELLLDPFADDGSLCIEAALLLSRTSPRKFQPSFSFMRFPALSAIDWNAWRKERNALAHKAAARRVVAYANTMRDMKAIRTNSKLASVDDFLLSTKVGVDWLDLKQEEDGIDRIVTAPMTSGKSLAPHDAAKLQDHLFYQAAYVLKKNGTTTCISDKPDEIIVAAKKHGFTLVTSHDVLMGKRKMTIVTLKNTKKPADGKEE